MRQLSTSLNLQRHVSALFKKLDARKLPVVKDMLIVTRVPFAGPDKKLKLSLNYPASVGRNMDEIVRVTDALMLSAKHSIVSGPSLVVISLSEGCWMMT
jgi:alkyl hydroperoxide reductase subunit AhpC